MHGRNHGGRRVAVLVLLVVIVLHLRRVGYLIPFLRRGVVQSGRRIVVVPTLPLPPSSRMSEVWCVAIA